ncbi:hypothetical protein ACFE04_029293 [Oxalis oulophora]
MTTGSTSSAALESRNWLDLPEDVTAQILMKLDAIDILSNVSQVCVLWWRLCKDSSMWQRINVVGKRDDLLLLGYDLAKLCREAVNRSEGQLIEINIDYICTDELLQYIAERSSGLKCLRLVSSRVTYKGMIKAAAKLRLLETLHLTHCCTFPKEVFHEVGKSCPLLKSFKYNESLSPNPYIPCNDDALVIAEAMPGLRHLQLVGNLLTDSGLRAILNGCPHLESLDLSECRHLYLRGGLEKRCVDQIKSLKLPDPPMRDRFPKPYATPFDYYKKITRY